MNNRNTGSDQVKEERIVHPIPPLYRADSEILILGSFPSVKCPSVTKR